MTRPPVWQSFAFGAVVVACAYADVLVGGRSLVPSLLGPYLDAAPPASPTVPSLALRRPWHGQGDLAASVTQHEAVLRGTAAALRAGDSLWWDRWSACGALGPEVITFARLSPVALLAALGGGGPLAFDLATLLGLALAIGAVHAALRLELGASSLAAAGGAAAYGLNGFVNAYLASQVIQPYLGAPWVLWALLHATRRPGVGTTLLAGAAHAALLCSTHVPVLAVSLFAVHTSVALAPRRDRTALRRALAVQVASLGAGLLATAWLWVPALDALRTVDTLSLYAKLHAARGHVFASWPHALSLLTPKHFWESNGGLAPAGLARSEYDIVPHAGVLFVALAAQAAPRAPLTRGAWVVIAVVLARCFGVPPIATWLSELPGLRVIRWQFWTAGLGLVLPLLVASGVDRLRAGASPRASATFGLVGALLVGALLARLGWPAGSLFQTYVLVTVALLVVGVVAVHRAGRVQGWRRALVAAAALELLVHFNHCRPLRMDRLDPEPPFIGALRGHVGDGRVLSIGWFGTPLPEWGQALRIRTADGMGTSNLPWYRAMLDRAVAPLASSSRPHLALDADVTLDHAVLDRLAIRAIVVGASCARAGGSLARAGLPVLHRDAQRTLFGNPGALDRVRVVPALEQGARVTASRAVAVCEDAGLVARARAVGIPEGPGDRRPEDARATIVHERNDALEVELELPWPGVLVVADTWHAGWSARVDGAPAEVARVDEALRGVLVPPGLHRVTLRYASPARQVGLALTGAGFLGLAGAVAYGRARRTQRPSP